MIMDGQNYLPYMIDTNILSIALIILIIPLNPFPIWFVIDNNKQMFEIKSLLKQHSYS